MDTFHLLLNNKKAGNQFFLIGKRHELSNSQT